MADLSLDGVPEDSLNRCIERIDELTKWAEDEQIDRWAFRASLLKALYEDADRYFASGAGTFREIAAFDNGVATAIRQEKSADPRGKGEQKKKR